MRSALSLVVATLVALVFLTGSATARERCCFKVTVRGEGSILNKWGLVSNNQIGEDAAAWDWVERMILVYHESGGSPGLSLATLGFKPVPPSSFYHRFTRSSVQISNGINPGYSPAADPGACGEFNLKLRQGIIPSLVPPSEVDPEDRASFPNAGYFLQGGSFTARDDLGCLYGHSLADAHFEDDQVCTGQHAFTLPAPRRAYFRKGTERIHKLAHCTGYHLPAANENHASSSTANIEVAFKWFPPARLKEAAQSLKKVHKEL
jgi:hypothetical protein